MDFGLYESQQRRQYSLHTSYVLLVQFCAIFIRRQPRPTAKPLSASVRRWSTDSLSRRWDKTRAVLLEARQCMNLELTYGILRQVLMYGWRTRLRSCFFFLFPPFLFFPPWCFFFLLPPHFLWRAGWFSAHSSSSSRKNAAEGRAARLRDRHTDSWWHTIITTDVVNNQKFSYISVTAFMFHAVLYTNYDGCADE